MIVKQNKCGVNRPSQLDEGKGKGKYWSSVTEHLYPQGCKVGQHRTAASLGKRRCSTSQNGLTEERRDSLLAIQCSDQSRSGLSSQATRLWQCCVGPFSVLSVAALHKKINCQGAWHTTLAWCINDCSGLFKPSLW